MKKLLLLCLVLMQQSLMHAQAPANAGFENWYNNNESGRTYLVPQGWISLDMILTSWVYGFDTTYSIHSVNQTNIAHSGQYAVEMTTGISSAGDTVPGFIYYVPTLQDYFTEGFSGSAVGYPFSSRPASFDGYYQFSNASTDLAVAQVLFTHWNTVTNSRDTVAFDSLAVPPSGSWTSFSMPIHYLAAEYPDTAIALIGIAHFANTATGSVLRVDDLAFSGNVPIGIDENKTANAVHTFPNPAHDVIIFSFENKIQENATISVYDAAGSRVLSESISGTDLFELDLKQLQPGMYFYRIENQEGCLALGKIAHD